MIKKYFEERKRKQKLKQYTNGYDYANNNLSRKTRSTEELLSMVDVATLLHKKSNFDYGIIDAVTDFKKGVI